MYRPEITKERPAIPTEFTEGFEVNGKWLAPGWYPVRISDMGLDYMTGTEVRYTDFERCKLACDLHNQTACGMSIGDIATLYAQRRFN